MEVNRFAVVVILWISLCSIFSAKLVRPVKQRDVYINRLDKVLTFAATLSIATASYASDTSDPAEFYAKYPYQKPSDILKYIYDKAKPGDAKSVLNAMELFTTRYPMYSLSHAKAQLLCKEIVLDNEHPTQILELGTFLGYSAINMALIMPSLCTLTTVEGNPENAEVAKDIISYAFQNNDILNRIRVIQALSSSAIDQLVSESQSVEKCSDNDNIVYFAQDKKDFCKMPQFDVVFMDHAKECYLPDLKKLESVRLKDLVSSEIVEITLLKPSAKLIADNVVFPGAPGFLEYLRESNNKNESGDESKRRKWKTKVEPIPFERIGFETKYKEVSDGMSISISLS